MLRRVQVESTGDCDFIPGQMVDKFEFQEKNAKVLAEGGEPATAKPVLLGVTRGSLLTDSFLSAASFQETTRVLTQAAVSGAQDWLLGLKENVIIGRLIPARLQTPAMQEMLRPAPKTVSVAPGAWLGITGGLESLDFPLGAGTTLPQEPGPLSKKEDGPPDKPGLNQALGAAEALAVESADDEHGGFGEADEVSSNGLDRGIGGQAGTSVEEVEGSGRPSPSAEGEGIGPGSHPMEHEPAD